MKALNDQQSGLWGMYGALGWSTNKSQATADYQKELELHPDTLWAYNDLTGLLASQGRLREAEQTLQAWA